MVPEMPRPRAEEGIGPSSLPLIPCPFGLTPLSIELAHRSAKVLCRVCLRGLAATPRSVIRAQLPAQSTLPIEVTVGRLPSLRPSFSQKGVSSYK